MKWLEAVKALFVARQPLTDLVNEVKDVKRGYKTVGFYVTLLGTLGTLAAALSGYLSPVAALEITTALGVAYNLARGAAKMDEVGVRPVLGSTEFWIGVLTSLSNGLVALKTGGINPQWAIEAQGMIGVAMTTAQSLGATQPPVQETPK